MASRASFWPGDGRWPVTLGVSRDSPKWLVRPSYQMLHPQCRGCHASFYNKARMKDWSLFLFCREYRKVWGNHATIAVSDGVENLFRNWLVAVLIAGS